MTTKSRAGTVEVATEQLWREVIAQLRSFVGRRIADPARADDLVADILLRIHQNLGSVNDRDRLAHWVSRIARNAVIDEYRRASRAREHFVDAPTDAFADEPGGSATVHDELAHCLQPLLDGLPPEQRRAVQMIDLDGMAQTEAADREGISLSGMKSRVQRGRRGLVELLGHCCALTLDTRGVPMDYTPDAECGCAGGCG